MATPNRTDSDVPTPQAQANGLQGQAHGDGFAAEATGERSGANDNEDGGRLKRLKRDLAYGPCAVYVPDNAKSLFGPSIAPSLTECGIEIALPPTRMPTAKARIERFFGTLKSLLIQEPLATVDMRRAEEYGYEVGKYAILMTQLQDLVDQAVEIHNNSTTTEFDKLSPNQLLEIDAQQNARALFYDVERIEHHVGVTAQAILDRNGVRNFGLRWRHKHKVREMLRNLKRTLGPDRVKVRKDGSVAIVVKIWFNPGDLSSFKVFDDAAKEWVRLESTEPEYTHRLSMGAHQLFERRRKQRNETFKTNEDRLFAVARTRQEMNEMVPDLSFQQRRRFAALYQSDELRKLSRRTYDPPQDGLVIIDRVFGNVTREDTGLPGDKPFSFDEAERDNEDHFEDKGSTKPDHIGFNDDEYDGIDFDAIPADMDWNISDDLEDDEEGKEG